MSRKTKSRKVKFIDLFAGIGGFHLAFHENGAECVFASEWDAHARATYEENFRAISPNLFESDNFAGDINKIDIAQIPDFDVLTGGFPCQPFSNAGRKKGFADTRGTLFHRIVEILNEKKPRAYFIENVRHLYNHDGGKTFATIKEKIIESGYTFDEAVVKGTDFNVPQHRPRLYMVGFRKDIVPEDFVFSFPEKLNPVSPMTMSDVFGGACSRDVGFTLRVGGRGSGIDDRRNWDSYLVDGEVRRLSPTEGKKMMGFPDDFIFPVTESQAMKQLGNAVVVPAISAVAAKIMLTLNKYESRT